MISASVGKIESCIFLQPWKGTAASSGKKRGWVPMGGAASWNEQTGSHLGRAGPFLLLHLCSLPLPPLLAKPNIDTLAKEEGEWQRIGPSIIQLSTEGWVWIIGSKTEYHDNSEEGPLMILIHFKLSFAEFHIHPMLNVHNTPEWFPELFVV